jgi:hypothetical protein
MKKHLPLTNDKGEVRELKAEDFKKARPTREVLPEIIGKPMSEKLLKRKRGQRGA